MAEPDNGTITQQLHLLAEEVVLALPAVEQVLQEAAVAAAVGTEHSCGITYVSLYGVLTVASSDQLANAVDELQYGSGDGPCLESMRTETPVRVEDTLTETRWDGYPALAAEAGVRASLSYPVLLEEQSIGAINLYSTVAGPWSADQDATLLLFSNQVAGILRTVRRMAADLVRDPHAAAAFQRQHDHDVATGILMAQQGCSAEQAHAAIAAAVAHRGLTTSDVVARPFAGHILDDDAT
jgi:GAF domain-containing protein